MNAEEVDDLLDQFKQLTSEQQLEVAAAIDHLTWVRRWNRICQQIDDRVKVSQPISEAEVDKLVAEVRREKPLSERS